MVTMLAANQTKEKSSVINVKVQDPIVHLAAAPTAISLIESHQNMVKDGLATLLNLEEKGQSKSKEFRNLENEINKNARIAASLIIKYEDEIGKNSKISLKALNKMIKDEASKIYKKRPDGWKSCVYDHNLSYIRNVREDIKDTVHDPKVGDDAGTLLKEFENTMGEQLQFVLAAMGINRDEYGELLAKLAAFKHELRPGEKGPSMDITTHAPVDEVVQIGSEGAKEYREKKEAEIPHINKNLSNAFGNPSAEEPPQKQ